MNLHRINLSHRRILTRSMDYELRYGNPRLVLNILARIRFLLHDKRERESEKEKEEGEGERWRPSFNFLHRK